MRRSEFTRAIETEFGARGDVLIDSLVLSSIGSQSPREAVASGVDPRVVWLAVCEAMDVPENRRYGVGRLERH